MKGQNSLYWRLSYTIEKLLKRSPKWVHMVRLSTYNTSYGRKKGQESKCQFDSWPLKVKNFLELCACRWRATYHWKALNEGYNFSLNLTLIGGLQKKIWVSKKEGIPISRILGLLTWESRKKWHLGVARMVNYRKYYEEEGGGFPQVQAMVSLVSPCISWFVHAPKVLQLCTTQLVVWFVHVHVNNWPTCYSS